MPQQLISPDLFKSLISSGSARSIIAIARPQGFSLCVRYGMEEGILTTFRGNIRYFKSSKTLLDYLNDLSVSHVEIDLSNYQRE